MWRTQEGVRVLRGAEAWLFGQALECLWDDIDTVEEIGDVHEVGVAAFDVLTLGQKLAMLVEVGEALLHESIAPPELTAVNEATVAAVFAELTMLLEMEVDDEESEHYWRRLILKACREVGAEELPELDSPDPGDWEFQIETLRERILWDLDYEDDSYLDDAPEVRGPLMEFMRIPESYYTAIAHEPRPTEIETLVQRLRALTHE